MTAALPSARPLIALAFAAMLGACALDADLAEAPEPLGDFRLGFAVVVAENAEKGPFSRDASPEELHDALKEAVEARMGRYEGDRYYHIAVSVAAYILAQPGIPIVASPKSVFILFIDLWDDENQVKLTEEPVMLTVVEDPGTGLIGSGYVLDREAQLRALSATAAREIEAWLRENGSLVGDVDRPREPTESGA